MQPLLGGKKAGGSHRRGGGRHHVAEHGVGAEGECQERGDQRRGAISPLALGLAPAEKRHRRGRGEEAHGQRRRPGLLGEHRPDAARQADQREGAEARGTLALGLLAVSPAALDADQEADGEREAKPGELFCFGHRSILLYKNLYQLAASGRSLSGWAIEPDLGETPSAGDFVAANAEAGAAQPGDGNVWS